MNWCLEYCRQLFDVYCRYTELPSGVLQIYDVQDSDKGAYSCSALNTFADAEGALPSSVLRHSKEAVLTVLNPTSGEDLKVIKSRKSSVLYQVRSSKKSSVLCWSLYLIDLMIIIDCPQFPRLRVIIYRSHIPWLRVIINRPHFPQLRVTIDRPYFHHLRDHS